MARRVYSDLKVRKLDSCAANLSLLQALADSGYERVALCHHMTLTKGVQLRPAPGLADLLHQAPLTKTGRRLEVLQRLTVTVDDPSLLHTLVSSEGSKSLTHSPFPGPVPSLSPSFSSLTSPPLSSLPLFKLLSPCQSSPAADSYDLLSVCPASDRVFMQACSVLPVDIVTVDLSNKLPFTLKYSQLAQAVERGLFLEICYSPALRGSSSRKYTIANAQDLVKGCRGKNVLVSSDAERALELRPPLDVVNLSQLFGLTDTQCKASITTSSRAVLIHANMRRHSAKAVVSSHAVPGKRKRGKQRKETDCAPLAKKRKSNSHS